MVSIVIVMMILAWYNYVFNTMWPKVHGNFSLPSEDPISLANLIIFNLLFAMLIWSFLQTMFTDPGQIPIYWGFRVGDPEGRR